MTASDLSEYTKYHLAEISSHADDEVIIRVIKWFKFLRVQMGSQVFDSLDPYQ